MDEGGNLCLEAENVVQILNEYFALVFTEEKDMEDSEICVEHANMLGHFEIKKEVVLGLLKSTKVTKFPGPDGICPGLLREAREEIAGALIKMFVSSLATREVLEDWRVANVVSLFKKEKRDNPGNYRPEVTKVINEDRAVDVAYKNFSKAFEYVPNGRLIQKIKMHGIHGIHIGTSAVCDIYKDLDENVGGWFSKFADNTKIGDIVDCVEGFQMVQQDIDQLQIWVEKWQMEFKT
eukprot:g35031.t1